MSTECLKCLSFFRERRGFSDSFAGEIFALPTAPILAHTLTNDRSRLIQQTLVQIEQQLVSQPDYGEQALEINSALISSGAIDVVVVDSVALIPKAELEGEMGDSFMGLHARPMSHALRKITGDVSRAGACMVFIQPGAREIGVMLGNPETTTGGRGLKFYSSARIEVRRIRL